VFARESQRERLGNVSVKGTIELLRFSQKGGEPPVSRWDAKNAFQDYIDGKRSFESLGELFQVETVRKDKVLFAGVREDAVNPEQQTLRDDGYLIASDQAVHDDLRKRYNGFDFFRMGQVQGKLVETFEREINNIGPMITGDFATERNMNVQTFIRDAAILSEYHGFVIFSSGERLATPPPGVTRLWSASMVLPNRWGYSLRNEILLQPEQNYAAPKCLYLFDADKFEAYLSSEYFTPAPNAWLPQHYTAISVDAGAEDVLAHVVRVTLEPDTASQKLAQK